MKKIIIITWLLITMFCLTNYAGQLGQNEQGLFYVKDDGNLAVSEWVEIDTDGQGIQMYYYYFGADGFMIKNGVTPDGYLVNGSGQWVKNGQIQVKRCPKKKNSTSIEFLRSRIKGIELHKKTLEGLVPSCYCKLDLVKTSDSYTFDCLGIENSGVYYKAPEYGKDYTEVCWLTMWTKGYHNTIYFEDKSKNINDIDTTVSTLICRRKGNYEDNEDDFYFNIKCNSVSIISIDEVDDSYSKRFN